ncbi:integ_memb_HG, integral membrane protein [Flavobacteriaceae bacterium]
MLKTFKIIAILEGISYIVLLSNMLFIQPSDFILYQKLLTPIGMSHGVLFIGYVALAILLKKSQNWNFISLGFILLASLLPFATFFIEKRYLKNA